MMDQIVDCIQQNPRWKIVSLSYGPDESVDADSEPDRFTAEIDRLAYEHDITFVIAVGNLDEHQRSGRSPLGLDRVKAPADAVNAIVGRVRCRPTAEPRAQRLQLLGTRSAGAACLAARRELRR